MYMKTDRDRVVIAGDVNDRDGIGVEVYRDDKLIIEIFRDDTKKTRIVSVFQENVSLELIEESIRVFKEKIPWDFIDYKSLELE